MTFPDIIRLGVESLFDPDILNPEPKRHEPPPLRCPMEAATQNLLEAGERLKAIFGGSSVDRKICLTRRPH